MIINATTGSFLSPMDGGRGYRMRTTSVQTRGLRKYLPAVRPDKTHPHLHPPLEGEETLLSSPFKGEIETGMGLQRYV
jgi:hypothetical protein